MAEPAPAHRAGAGGGEPALIVAAYPTGSPYADPAAEREMGLLIDAVRAVRNIRAEKKVEPGKHIEAYVAADDAATRAMLEGARRTSRRWRACGRCGSSGAREMRRASRWLRRCWRAG